MIAKKSKKSRITSSERVPYYFKPANLSYEDWQKALRRQYALDQNFKVKNLNGHPVFSDFEVTNPQNQKVYKVAIRSEKIGLNYCSCPDFKINTLGTCKHIEYTLHQLKRKRGASAIFKQGFTPSYSSISLRYGMERKVVLRIGLRQIDSLKKLASGYFDENHVLLPQAYDHFEKFLEAVLRLDPQFRCYSDAFQFIVEMREDRRRRRLIEERYSQGVHDPRLDALLKTSLYPYQKEGILFAAKAGRALIADDMGLGKTIQAMGAAELMAKEFGIEKVLVICPTSLKYQWLSEIEKFTTRSACAIEGSFLKRREQYLGPEFFKIATYHAVQNDLEVIQKFSPDLVILDEAQRIKNWKTRTARNIKRIASPYALVLTGTPLENRLEELHSIVEFVDRFKLGPLFRFLEKHQVLDENGKVVGYRSLHEIGSSLSSILIRRHKKEVLEQLPPRIEKHFFVPVTEEQWKIHQENYETVCRLVNKWRRFKFLSEKDRQILMICLNSMRMVSNNTFILDEKTRKGPKIDEMMTFLKEVFEREEEKVVIFSQWERMTRLVAERLEEIGVGFESLHGGVPSRQRKDLLHRFHHDPKARVFLSTDAGGVGLNLQCASMVINLDCPWNPAVLEQRIARVHRLGQKKPVHVVHFISSGTIEEELLKLLKFKRSLFEGVLDGGQSEVFMGEDRFKRFMKTVELVAKSSSGVAPKLEPKEVTQDTGSEFEREEQESEGAEAPLQPMHELMTAGVTLLEKLRDVISKSSSGSTSFSSFVEKDQNTGRPILKIPLPNEEVLNKLNHVWNVLAEALKK
ncbi:MAG: DEAD/DEAH box helicase [Chlamydiae bacterium]|nr:DEAD/DEAH box helicase [Chlamydiota bacterium]MBI3277972.1 DEAD/DEAH box helicase [Chlamydiota bacterium]